ncbi:MFS transporter [Asticcacaulis taihuensis]|uniref:Drug resistance transporter, EmrB/QacA subfamily n=1 Tax=Asticcacaulis taihuensis TaxID=260084 RepID=A0A1G4Q744_9CAUL|nr:MFS transporter [Asticcacaulis taihuensis]SCW40400.1 drug resistance transporter, EmrB/QacA subfamily [Asticcacaulis taihuensis]
MSANPQTLPAAARWGLASLSLSMLMPSLDTSIANVGLPTLAEAFGATFQEVRWVVIAYLIAITALIVSAGRLGDLFGRRRLLLAGIALFTLTSLLCGTAPALSWLIAMRAAQGLGAAIMMALTIAMVSETVPPTRTGSAMGMLGTMSAIGTSLGPSLGGALITALGWEAIFLINVPLGVLNLWLAWRYLPADNISAKAASQGLDISGTLLLVITLAAYALALTTARPGLASVSLLSIAVLAAGGFIYAETRASFPLVRLTMFCDPALSVSLTVSTLIASVMMATLVIGPFYLSRKLGLDPINVGLVMSVGPVLSALSGVVAGRLVDRFGASHMVAAGLFAMTFGAAGLAVLPPLFGIAGYIAAIGLLTPGYQLTQAANNTALMTGVPADQKGVVSGMLSLSRNLGLITGTALMGAVFALASGTEITIAQPEAVAGGMKVTFLMAAILMCMPLAMAVRTSRLARKQPA